VPIPERISDYLREFASELGERILDSFPPLHGVNDPPSPMIGKLLRKPYPAQTQAIMGPAKGSSTHPNRRKPASLLGLSRVGTRAKSSVRLG
jgi:hypothetical protein